MKHLLHLNNGQLGSILLAIPLGQLLMMGFSGVLVSKLGSKKMLVVAEVFYAAVLLAMGCSSTVFHLTLSLVLRAKSLKSLIRNVILYIF